MRTLTLNLTGMTCEQCAARAQAALNAIEGVSASVSFADARATITVDRDVPLASLRRAITRLGYEVRAEDDNPANGAAQDRHIAIVGTGSAAFAAAIKAAERNARVTLIEAAEVIGGTCVNIGCVPSKILIRAAHIAHQQGHHHFAGIAPHRPVIDRPAMLAQQQDWVKRLRHAKYERILEDQPAIRLLRGRARFHDPHRLIVTAADGMETEVGADHILLATGSRPLIPDIPGLQDTPFWTSTEALGTGEIPDRLLVLGGSTVALELAQAFHRLGARVSVLARSTLLSRQDARVGTTLKQILVEEGLDIMEHARIGQVRHDEQGFLLETNQGSRRGDRLLVATGRTPNTEELDLQRAGVTTNAHGAILVDEHLRTNVGHIHAAGDCTDLPRFVYVAAAAGTRAAINMTGGDSSLDLSVLPEVTFTDPQVASVGLTEQQARDRGLSVESRELELEHVPRALASMDTRGFIKLVAEQPGGRLLGAQIVAVNAGEIIQTAALAIRNHMTVETLAGELFPYLTMVEGLKLCAQTFSKDVTRLSCCAG